MAAAVVAALRVRGMTVATSTGWDAFHARLIGSFTVDGEMVSSAYPEGAVQFRVDLAPRPTRIVALAALVMTRAFAGFAPDGGGSTAAGRGAITDRDG